MATRERTRTPTKPPACTDDFMETATIRLRWLVERRGLTAAVISRRGGLTAKTINRYLRLGVPRHQSGPAFIRLCNGLEACPNFMLGFSDSPNGSRR